MIRRSTLVVVILFLLLLAAALYLSRNPLPSAAEVTPTPTEQVKLLPDLTAQEITSIEMKRSEGELVSVKQDASENWVVNGETGRVTVSPGKIEQARDELAAALVIASLPTGYSLTAVGLDNPQIVFTLGTSTGQTFLLRVGSETPTSGGRYVQVNNAVPVVVNNAVVDTATNLLIEAAAPPESTDVPGSTGVP